METGTTKRTQSLPARPPNLFHQILSPNVRWRVLEYAFECRLPPLDGPDYYFEWSMPLTAQRLKKMANTLAALTRNAKRRDAMSYAKAIDDWEDDLVLLRDKYYLDFFHFGWPATHVLQ